MPVQSEKQRRFMYASLAGKTDVSPSVAKKFVGPSAHKAEGGTVKESKEMMKKRYPKKGLDGTIPAGIRAVLREKEQDALTPSSKYAKGGKIDGCAQRGKTRGRMV